MHRTIDHVNGGGAAAQAVAHGNGVGAGFIHGDGRIGASSAPQVGDIASNGNVEHRHTAGADHGVAHAGNRQLIDHFHRQAHGIVLPATEIGDGERDGVLAGLRVRVLHIGGGEHGAIAHVPTVAHAVASAQVQACDIQLRACVHLLKREGCDHRFQWIDHYIHRCGLRWRTAERIAYDECDGIGARAGEHMRQVGIGVLRAVAQLPIEDQVGASALVVGGEQHVVAVKGLFGCEGHGYRHAGQYCHIQRERIALIACCGVVSNERDRVCTNAVVGMIDLHGVVLRAIAHVP